MAWFFSKSPAGPAKTVKELGKRLVECGLVSQAHFDETLGTVPQSKRTPESVTEALESRGYLSSFQASLVNKGDIEGLVLDGHKLTYRNAAGSFARVYRAEAPDGATVAVKVLRGRHAQDKSQVAAFRREAEMAAKLKHPNVVPILHVGEVGDKHFFTMEFVEGGNLRDFLQIRKKLAPPEAVKIARDVADGLAGAFRYGVTHRDLKPTNVLLDTTGTAKLVDFGLGGEGDDGADLRAVEYATLEKATKAPRDDPRSDLFFLGGILYELLAGEPPWPPSGDKNERRQVARYRDVRPIADHEPDLPDAVVAVVDRLLCWSPTERFQSAKAAADALRALSEQLGEPAGRASHDREATDPSGVYPSAELTGTAEKPLPRLMCVESSAKNRERLRGYFGTRGFRVSLVSDPDRALARCKDDPPDAVLLMGESLGDELFRTFSGFKAIAAEEALAIVALVNAEQADKRNALEASGSARVLTQPASLRDVRTALHLALQRVLSESRMIRLRDYKKPSGEPAGDPVAD